MLSLTHPLDNQMACYRESIDEEPWKTAHYDAMRCMALEDCLRFGISLYENIQSHRERVAEMKGQISGDDFDRSMAKADELEGLWMLPCTHVEAAIRHFESRHYEVSGAERFREICSSEHEAEAAHRLQMNAATSTLLERAKANLRRFGEPERKTG